MISDEKYYKGFSLVEIIVSMMILAIAAGAVFATFLSTARLRVFSENELEAHYNALSWLEQVRTGATVDTQYNQLPNHVDMLLDDTDSILTEDYDNWPMANKPKVQMTDARYTVSDVDLGSGVLFKRIAVTARWEEQE
jgi:prepilin-type N-terminal cleavage/methylation domain-containing protein